MTETEAIQGPEAPGAPGVPAHHEHPSDVFADRIASQLPAKLTGRVAYASNLGEVMEAYPGQRIYSFFTFVLDKAPP